MGTPVFNVEADQGGTIAVTVDVTEADGTASNLTGYTGEMQVRTVPSSDEVLATGTVVITPTTGRVVGTIPASETADAEWRAAHYDIRITDGTTIEYVVRGTIKLRETVTR